ncbi:hypothetical protein SAMN06269117_11434 [Balnearium lithotrophicum]|uniref:Uncharacterized protein n=1 Tax=Balnearium lithotrophicum TaxID=223788 RepID=A0A521CP41_9BACT|nr:hypothetical protein [Balnearium lithotrophicum]SMO61196.1 hypothetical protein SAMN06269117_11434 [Balnearium lithotrophicum]
MNANFELILNEELEKVKRKEALAVIKLYLTETQSRLEAAHDLLLAIGEQKTAKGILEGIEKVKKVKRRIEREV